MRFGIDTPGVFALIASLGFGCASPVRVYDGAPRGAGEVARVLASHPESPAAVRASAVDGREVEGSRWELLPGEHVLSAYVYDEYQTTGEHTVIEGGCELHFVARAGASYRLEGSHEGGCSAWLVDRSSREEHARCSCETARHTSVRKREDSLNDAQPIVIPMPFPMPAP